MQNRTQILILALISMFLFFGTFSALAADVFNNTTTINIAITGNVAGNSNSTDIATNLSTDPNVPPSGSPDEVYNNQVIINTGGGVSLITYGGFSYGDGDVYSNKITINSDGTVARAYGGYTTGLGSVNGNIINILSGGWTTHSLYGGYILNSNSTAAVNGNEVIIGGTGYNGGIHEIFGGYTSGNGIASGNSVTITSTGLIGPTPEDQAIIGGFSKGGDVIGNRVTIESGGGTYYSICGGSAVLGSSSLNIVIIEGYASYSIVTGGASADGNAISNSVFIGSDSTVWRVYGGRVLNDNGGVASGNSVDISGSVRYHVYGGESINGAVTGNSVEISGTVGQDVYGGHSDEGAVTGNSVEISGTVGQDAYGGYSSEGAVTGNSVEISGTVNNDVYGGFSYGDSGVAGNSISIASGGSAYNVYGGFVDASWGSAAGDVTGNSVAISGTVNDYVFGGYTTGSGTVDNNTVTVESTANLASASLFGRNSNSAGGTGNTLNVNSFAGDVVEMNNFDTYNITIGELDSTLTVIHITGTTPTDIDNAKVNIYFASEFANNALSFGDTIIVISSINMPTYTGNAPIVLVEQASPFVTYDYIETHDTGQLLLTLTGLSVNPETSFVGEGFAAGLAFLGQAADVRSSIYFVPQGPRFIPFAKMVYGKQYISTGSSVNVKGFSAIAGLALNTNFDNGSQLVVGAFVEGGWGDYDSRNSFRNSASIKGKGDTEYYGGGVLARYALKSGLYGEGTFAAGKTETDFRTYDYVPGTRSKYDYSVPYYSAHVAVGKLFNMCDIFSLDLYGKYLWTRQAGDNVTMDGYRFKFKATDSHRVRVGGRLQSTALQELQPYVGAAYEYEFSGKIKGSLYGMGLDKPSLRGSTGIGELGLVWTPNDAQNLRVDLGVQGYAGKREGVSGSLTVTMSF